MDASRFLAQCYGKAGPHNFLLVLSCNGFCRKIMWAQNPERSYLLLQSGCPILMAKHTIDWYIHLDMLFSAIFSLLKDQFVGSRRSPSCTQTRTGQKATSCLVEESHGGKYSWTLKSSCFKSLGWLLISYYCIGYLLAFFFFFPSEISYRSSLIGASVTFLGMWWLIKGLFLHSYIYHLHFSFHLKFSANFLAEYSVHLRSWLTFGGGSVYQFSEELYGREKMQNFKHGYSLILHLNIPKVDLL